MKTGVECLAQHPGWKSVPRPKAFFRQLSGEIEYRIQWGAWKALCEKNGVDADIVLDLLIRARKAAR